MAYPVNRFGQPYVPAQEGPRENLTQRDTRTTATARGRIPSGQAPVSVRLTPNAAAHQSAPSQPVTVTVTQIANGCIVQKNHNNDT